MKKSHVLIISFLTLCVASSNPITSTIPLNNEIGIKSKFDIPPFIPLEPVVDGQSEQFQADCAAYGLSVSEQWYPYSGTTFQKETYYRYDAGYLQYQTDIQQVLLQNANSSNVFSVVYRVVTSPVSRSRNWGFLGIGSHSDAWYTREINSSATLGNGLTIAQWAPQNEAAHYSGSIGVGYDGNNISISASVNYEIDQLSVVSRTNVATGYYETEYDISLLNNYNSYSAVYLGFFTFTRTNSSVSPIFSISHRIEYLGLWWFSFETNNYVISL